MMCSLHINIYFDVGKFICGLYILSLVYEILSSWDHKDTQLHFLLLAFGFTFPHLNF